MSENIVPSNETGRIRALKNYDVRNSLSQVEYDRITALAALICNVPISLITFIDEDTQWFKSKIGLDINSTSRDIAFCRYTITGTELFEVNNADADIRFSTNPLVTEEPNIKFYAGFPLVDPDGFALGTLCVIDKKQNQLHENQKEALRLLSLEVMGLVKARRLTLDLLNFEKLFLLSDDLLCVVDTDGNFKKINPAFQQILGWSSEELTEKNLFQLIHPSDLSKTQRGMEELKEGKSIVNFEHRVITVKGNYKTIQWMARPEVGMDNIFATGRDVTEYREKESRLLKSESYLRALFENSQGLLCTHDLDGNFISINKAGADMIGYHQEQLRNMNLFDIVPQQKHAHLRLYLRDIASSGRSKGELHIHCRDGSLKTIIFHNVLEKFSDDEPYVLGNGMDVTDREIMEAQLLQVSETLEQTNQVARVGGWRLDLDRNELSWTSVTREIHDAPEGYMPKLETAIDFYKKGQSRDKISEAIYICMSTWEGWDLELQIITLSGKEKWVRAIGKAVLIDGELKSLYGSFQDIDVRKRNDIIINRSRAILSAFAKHTPAAVAMLDENMRYVAVSNRWKEEYGLNGQQLIGSSYYEHFKFITDEGKERHKRILAGAVESKEEDVFYPSGQTEPEFLKWEMRPWYESEGKIGGMMIFTQNMTAYVRQNEELKNAKISAEKASIAKSDFLSNMSHEIRTPLNAIIGFTDLVLKTELSPAQQQYLKIVNQSSNDLLNIINDILDFSKIEAGKLVLVEECADLYELCSQSIDIISYQVQQKGVELLLNISPEVPRFVWTDPVRLKQIIYNLLSNASKFTSNGEIELQAKLLNAEDDYPLIRFSVSDTGIGIKSEKLDKIFEAFEQEDTSTSKKYGGTGLGLSISNKLLKMMGSQMKVNSILGEGSEFYFDVLLRAESVKTIDSKDLSWIDQILIVDDNVNNLLILKSMLAVKGINIQEASNGIEAMEILRSGKNFDAMIVDYHMPYLTGIETVDKMRENFPDLMEKMPILLLHSSYDDEIIGISCKRSKINCRLSKPVKSEDLFNCLSSLRDGPINGDNQPTIKSNFVDRSPIKVLVADDNPVNMLLTVTYILNAYPNSKVIEAVNGREAFDMAVAHLPDLILMDIQMPVMNGYESTSAIRKVEECKLIPIIALTAANLKEDLEKCINAGLNDFLSKPVAESALLEIFNKWLPTGIVGVPVSDALYVDKTIHFNSNVLQDRLGGNQIVLLKILSIAQQQLSDSSSLLTLNFEKGNLPELNRIGHKLYGTSVSAGFPRLAEFCRTLETMESLDGVLKIYNLIIEEIKICFDLLKELKSV